MSDASSIFGRLRQVLQNTYFFSILKDERIGRTHWALTDDPRSKRLRNHQTRRPRRRFLSHLLRKSIGLEKEKLWVKQKSLIWERTYFSVKWL